MAMWTTHGGERLVRRFTHLHLYGRLADPVHAASFENIRRHLPWKGYVYDRYYERGGIIPDLYQREIASYSSVEITKNLSKIIYLIAAALLYENSQCGLHSFGIKD
jgi:hypothetical protein